MAKRKSGLHRKVSSIFDGVSVSRTGSSEQGGSAVGWTDTPGKDEKPQQQGYFMPKDMPAEPTRFSGATGPGDRPRGPRLGGLGYLGPVQVVSERRRKTTIVLMVVLFIVLVLVLTSTFSRNLGKKNIGDDTLERATATGEAIAASRDVQIDWEIPPKYPETLRDPMETTWAQDPDTGEWVEEPVVVIEEGQEQSLIDVGIALRSILWAETGRSIVIGNEILYEGDEILGVTIKKINKDSVEFEKDGIGFLKVFPR